MQASVNKLFESPGFGDVRELEQEMSRLERHRLLYVATTRARDHLILSVHQPNVRKGSETDAQLLLDAAEAGDAVHQVLEAPTFRLQPTPGPEPTPGPHDDATARQRWDAERAEILGRFPDGLRFYKYDPVAQNWSLLPVLPFFDTSW